jgi:type I restriction-modification system DNA methylase subunit
MSSAPPRIVELVKTFDRNIETYHSQQYNETQLRREFIDPFFEELGWDVSNKQGYAQAYKEVIHEDAVKVGTATKAPDYSFRIGGVRKFFLEAKKPSINIGGDPHPAYQLRRYAWSAKLPVSILTDFEEFAVYDCQMRPKQTDGTSTARIMFLTCKDYLDKWDEIADIFSKEAVLKGSFDKFAVSTKAKRGTTTVDTEFLAEIENWRQILAKVIALRNRTLSIRELNFAVQRTIDRILFLRMCEDRGIENYGQLLKISAGDRTYLRLCEIFEKADQIYNSGLFHFTDETDRAEPPDKLTLNLIIDDKDLKWILHNLYYPQSPYEFSVLPAEILGNVYEQFLGKVILVSPARHVKIEPKPEVKKAGGIYYTPDYIVDYIVKNTVGRLLGVLPCHSRKSGNPQPRHSERSEESQLYNSKSKIVNRKSLTPKQVANLRILDPACGSGSFLLGAYTYLLNYIRDWYVESNPAKYTKQIYQGRGGQWFLTIAEKKRILLNNIFGVDIDSQAVEVTKLSLLLKVLEGENQQTLENQYRLFHERALPDLGNNIKCGNSLIGSDFFDNPDIDSSNEELCRKINPFDWHAEFPQVFKQNRDRKGAVTSAAPQTDGFHAVIGNPPYIFARGGHFDEKTKRYYYDKFPLASYQLNTYLLFIDQAYHLLNKGSYLGFIIPNTWLTIDTFSSLRKFLLEETGNLKIVNIFDKVFGKANVDTCLLIFNKEKPNSITLGEFKEGQLSIIGDFPTSQFKKNNYIINIALAKNKEKAVILDKIKDFSKSLNSFSTIKAGLKAYETGKGTPAQTDTMKKNRVYHSKSKEGNDYGRYLKGKDVKRYVIKWGGLWIKYGECLAAPRDEELFTSPRILVRQIPSPQPYSINAVFTKEYFLNDINSMIIYDFHGIDPLFILAILNSKIITFWFANTFDKFQRKIFPQFKVKELTQFPIRTIDFDNPDDVKKHDQMVKLVDRMLDLHKKLTAAKVPDEKTNLQRQITTTDNQIDNLVYNLYGLTEEEIRIVEEREKQ